MVASVMPLRTLEILITAIKIICGIPGHAGATKEPAGELGLQVFAGGLFWSVAENPVNGASAYWPKLTRTVVGDLAAKVEPPTAVARAV
jgi:hypothetical protein